MNPADPPLLIRPMVPADLDPVLALAAASPEAPQWPQNIWASYLPPQPHPALLRTAVVAVQHSTILGFACATLLPDSQPTDAQPASRQQNLCELDSIAVHPSARRRGIGAALLREILAWAAAQRVRRLVLEVRASNAAALRLYQSLGLAEEGRRPRYYTHPEEDALLLGTPVTCA